MDKLKVLYDGRCHLCHREIRHYIKKDKQEKLIPIDITDERFDAKQYDLDPSEVNKHIHTIDEQGRVYTKIDSFIQIWERLPSYGWAAKVASIPSVKWVMDKLYIVFAEYIRPKLPKKSCQNNSCSL